MTANRNQSNVTELPHHAKIGGPGSSGGGDDFASRLTRVEVRLEALDARMAQEAIHLDKRLEAIERRLDRLSDKIPSKWDLAQVIFGVMASLMAAAYFAPRLVSLIPGTP